MARNIFIVLLKRNSSNHNLNPSHIDLGIWITKDIYYPNECALLPNNDSDTNINIPSEVELYKGFIGVSTKAPDGVI